MLFNDAISNAEIIFTAPMRCGDDQEWYHNLPSTC
jgi:hypothetical protein